MCGISGIFDFKGRPVLEAELRAVHDGLVHRGPDDCGCFANGEIGLGFQRLSILDLRGGRQPMSSPDGRFTLVFNGELYNHKELRPALQAAGWSFRTASDTETLLAGLALKGRAFLGALNGMFACALWDAQRRELTLARDPLGIKPLYTLEKGGRLYFSSELRALIALTGGEPDPAAVFDYLSFGYVHAPATVIAGAGKFPPGSWASFGPGGARAGGRFWRLPEGPGAKISEAEAAAELGRLLDLAVRDQLASDVPVGVFLSGGIDSSLVTALMARHTGGRVRSYSVGFDGGESVDETRYAESVARYLGTSHTTLRLPAGVLDRVEESVACLDEPVADAAVLPTFYLSREARKSVKVVLTGEGGDEVFGGYGRHKAAWVGETLRSLPPWLARAALPAARRAGRGAYFRALPADGPRHWALAEAAPYLAAASAVLTVRPPEMPWLGAFDGLGGLNGMLSFDLQTSMADQLLMKVDKTTMRASLEARVPLLDLRLVNFMFGLPAGLKIRRFRGKYLLRRAAAGLLPREILTRRKHGFVLRCAGWMRSPANRLCGEVLGGSVLPGTGLFRRDALLEGLAGLRAGSPAANPVFYFRLLLLGLWLDSVKGRGRITKM